jgi:hypothetical protein
MSASDTGKRPASVAVIALGLALIGAGSMLYYHMILFRPRVQIANDAKHLGGGYAFGDDFYPIWLTSRLWLRERRDPYSPAVTREIQTGLFGRALEGQLPTDPPTDYRTFVYPAFTNLLFWWTAETPFPVWPPVLAGLLTVLTAVSVLFWSQALSWRVNWIWLAVMLLLTVCSYPVLEGLYAGQLGLLVGFLLAASVLALVRGRMVLSGILMALTTIKPQMTILAILYLFVWSVHDWRNRGRFFVAFFATMFALIGASLAVWPHWIQSWAQVLLGYHHYATPPLISEVLGSSLGRYTGTALIVIAVIPALVLTWRSRAAAAGSDEFWLTLSFLLAITTITLLPGQAVHDQVILLPGIFLLAARREESYTTLVFQGLLVLGIGVLLWPWFATLGLIILRPFVSGEFFYSKGVFAMPLRTAASFPFVVVGLLALALRMRLQRQAKLTPATSLPARPPRR